MSEDQRTGRRPLFLPQDDHDLLVQIATIIENDHVDLKKRVKTLEDWMNQSTGRMTLLMSGSALIGAVVGAFLGHVLTATHS